MIGFINGIVEEVFDDQAVINVNNVGYNVLINSGVADRIKVGNEARIYTYLSVREDAMKLFGFISREDLEFFKLLISVNGVGPKSAQTILAAMTVDELRYAILSGDVKTLSKCPGVGAKSAQRIILDLKDKVDIADVLMATEGSVTASNNESGSEVVEALVALGFSATSALSAVKKIENADSMSVEDMIKAALKFLY